MLETGMDMMKQTLCYVCIAKNVWTVLTVRDSVPEASGTLEAL